MSNTKKWVSLSKLSNFLDNLKETFSIIGHKHTLSDLTDYTVDTTLSSTSANPVANSTLNAEFDAISDAMGALENAIDSKSDSTHDHNSIYYTESEIDSKVSTINTSITNVVNGTTKVAKATNADSATNATNSTKATQDASGNVITSTYETKTDASAKLTEAKQYADNAATTVKNDLLNGAGGAYDTLKELGDLIDDNVDAIDALETVAAGKADKVHAHAISDVTDLQNELDGKSDSNHTHNSIIETNSGLEQKFWRGTKTEYEAIATKDDNTMYIITDDDGDAVASYGDMEKSIYDPQGKETDVFAYVDIRVPAWTEADEGKFLRIVNGVPTWATVDSAEEVKF